MMMAADKWQSLLPSGPDCIPSEILCDLLPSGIHKSGARVCGFEVSVGGSCYFERPLSVNRLPSLRRAS
jgi:hypothetical protein